MHDLVIRGGTIIDGTGSPGRVADLAIDGRTIVAIGDAVGAGRRETTGALPGKLIRGGARA